VLGGDHSAGGKVAAIPNPLDLINDWRLHIAGTEEVTVQGVDFTPLNGLPGGDQRLPQHLAAEDTGATKVLAVPAEKIFFEFFKRQMFEEILNMSVHIFRLSRFERIVIN
jgi:hypothetical protein